MNHEVNLKLTEFELRLLREWVNKRCSASGYYASVDLQVKRILDRLDEQLNDDKRHVTALPEESI